jgi:hypothetical protein
MMMTTTTSKTSKTYTIRDYNSGESLGQASLTAEDFAAYEAAAQQPEGLIKYGDLKAEMKHVDGPVNRNTVVYLD